MKGAVFALACNLTVSVLAVICAIPVKASPCDQFQGQVDYCYIWLGSAGFFGPLVDAIRGSSSRGVVLANEIGGGLVEAITPRGYTNGMFIGGPGNLSLYNGIKCRGKRDTSIEIGRVVDYGYCIGN